MHSPRFTGNVNNEDDVHAFIQDALPDLSPTFHEELTAFLLSLDHNPTLTPASSVLVDTRTDIQKVMEEFVEAKFKDVPRLIQIYENLIIHGGDQIESFVFQVAPDIPQEQRTSVAKYIQSKQQSFKIAPEDEEFLHKLCARRPEIKDVVLFLTDEMTIDDFMELHGDAFRNASEGLSE